MKIRKRFENQAVGLLPLLLFMVMDNYLSYKLSFAIGVVVSLLIQGIVEGWMNFVSIYF